MGDGKRCLVTGGAGFIGSHIVDSLFEAGHYVAVLDNLSSGKRKNLPEGIPLYEMSILDDLQPVFEKEKPQVVFHQAAQISVSYSVREPEFDASVNIGGTIHLLEACRQHGVEKILYASSGAVYGEPQSLPLKEDDPMLALSPYGISKGVPERYLYYYRHQFGLDFVALRYANVYGPRQDPHGEAGVVSIFTEKLMADEQPIVYGDGEQTRDFVFVKDVARANIMAINAEIDPSVFPAFNVSTNKQTTVNTIYDLIQHNVESKRNRQHGQKRAGDVLHSCLSNEKIKHHFGWEPLTSVEEGISQTVAFFKAQS